MAQAAYTKLIKVSTDGNTWYTVSGVNDASISRGGEVLDDTAFEESHDGFRSRLIGLRDWSINASGDYDGSDTNGQLVILSAWENGTALYVQYLPDGTNGVKGQCVVESFEQSGDVAGKEQMSFVLQADGALSAA